MNISDIVYQVWDVMSDADKQSCASGFIPEWILDVGLSDENLNILKEWSIEEKSHEERE